MWSVCTWTKKCCAFCVCMCGVGRKKKRVRLSLRGVTSCVFSPISTTSRGVMVVYVEESRGCASNIFTMGSLPILAW